MTSGHWPATFPPHVGKVSAPGHIELSHDLTRHLLRRVTYGANDALVKQVQHMGVGAWLDQQLTPQKVSDKTCSNALGRFPLLNTTALQLTRTLKAQDKEYGYDGMYQTSQATLMRAVLSNRQLYEVMVEFWNNHFNVTCPSDKVRTTRHVHDRVVIRKHALGTFEDMLLASAKSPAMLYFLDNADSDGSPGSDPNENYGRELLELHTVGIGNYNEHDIRMSAYTMTGWSVQDDGSDTFVYKPGYRYVGKLKVMGWHNANANPLNGVAVGTSYLKYLAHHPATAYHVCRKLAVRFVSDTPSSALVSKMAQTFLQHGTQIVPVLRVMFSSGEFWKSLGGKVRRPYEFGVATMRTLGYGATADHETDDWGNLVYHLGELGQAPLAWDPPNGYPDTQHYWESTATTLGQWKSAIALVGGYWADGKNGVRMTDVTIPGLRLKLNGSPTAGELVDALSQRLLGQHLTAGHRGAILDWYEVPSGKVPPDWKLDHGPIQQLSALVLSSPVWNLR